MKKRSYGFIDKKDLPGREFQSADLRLLNNINWAKTSTYKNEAVNHCAAVFLLNLMIYFKEIGYDNLQFKNIDKAFYKVHNIVGNGPKIFIAPKAKAIFIVYGYSLLSKNIKSFSELKQSINNNRPLGLLLYDGILNWHWVMAVGWREYNNGDQYIRIVDGWNATSNKYYKINSGSAWWSATSYAIKD